MISVPYDTLISLWYPLFWMRCFIYGKIKGNEYYERRGGHVNNFVPKEIVAMLERFGFKVLEIKNDARLFFTVVAQKNE